MDEATIEAIEREYGPPRETTRLEEPLFHYTDAAAFVSIVERREIWATDARFLNDRTEMVVGQDIIRGVAEYIVSHPRSPFDKNFFDAFGRNYTTEGLSKYPSPFIASFSPTRNPDLLPFWMAYGAYGSGYAIGFQSLFAPGADYVCANPHVAIGVVRCEYDRLRFMALAEERLRLVAQGFERYARQHIGDQQGPEFRAVFELFMGLALRHAAVLTPRMKDPAFKDEHEVRLIAVPEQQKERDVIKIRPTRGGVVPYIPIRVSGPDDKLALVGIMVGPALDHEHRVAAAQLVLDVNGCVGAVARASNIPFRAPLR